MQKGFLKEEGPRSTAKHRSVQEMLGNRPCLVMFSFPPVRSRNNESTYLVGWLGSNKISVKPLVRSERWWDCKSFMPEIMRIGVRGAEQAKQGG